MIALVIADPQRWFIEGVFFFGRILPDFDLTKFGNGKMINGGGMLSSISPLFSMTGISFSLGSKALVFAGGKLGRDSVLSVICYEMHVLIHDVLVGNWDVVKDYDENLVKRNLEIGEVFFVTHYTFWHFFLNIERGCFSAARRLVDSLLEVSSMYENDEARAVGFFTTALLLVKTRKIRDALSASDEAIRFSQRPGSEIYLLAEYSLKTRIQLMMGDLQEAEVSLQNAHGIALRIDTYPRGLSWFLESQFIFNLLQLKAVKKAGQSKEIAKFRKDALVSGKKAVKNARKVAGDRTEIYKWMGVYYLLIDKQKKALSWWTKSIAEGERLDAKLELSRTYFEVGKCLLEPHSKYKGLNGISAEKYLEKARVLFEEMELEWDLAELEKVVGSFPSA